MNSNARLTILKKDLQMLTTANDDYLKVLLDFAERLVRQEGIAIVDDLKVDMAIIHYASYLFRKRDGENTAMPRYLRYELNQLIFSQGVTSEEQPEEQQDLAELVTQIVNNKFGVVSKADIEQMINGTYGDEDSDL